MRRITIWILVLCLLFGTAGCSACTGFQPDDPANPAPASGEPQNVEPAATPEEEEIILNPKGEESALPTLPAETQPAETDMPQTPEPEKSEAPSDTPAPQDTEAPSPTPGPTEKATAKATAKATEKATQKPTATPSQTATPSPTATPTDDDIELPPLP